MTTKALRPHRFPSLTHLRQGPGAEVQGAIGMEQQAQGANALAEGFQQGLDKGYREGWDNGEERGRQEGLAAGLQDGRRQGLEEGHQEVIASFDGLARPLDAALAELTRLRADYQAALRKEVVDLVGKVARQVIRCELALQPTQLLALVDETLAVMPPVPDGVEIYLNPEDCLRISELAPERAGRWTLVPDARLEPGECRVKVGDREADAGCRQRLAACMDQVRTQLLESDDVAHPPAGAEDATVVVDAAHAKQPRSAAKTSAKRATRADPSATEATPS